MRRKPLPFTINPLRRSQEGVALLEFAISFPFLLFLCLGTIELIYYVLVNQKLDYAAQSFGDIVGRNFITCQSDLDDLANNALPELLEPFDINDGYKIILNLVQVDQSTFNPEVYKRAVYVFGATPAGGSEIAAGGIGSGTDLAGFDYNLAGNSFITVETYYRYNGIILLQPLARFFNPTSTLDVDHNIYKAWVLKSRYYSPIDIVPDTDPYCTASSNHALDVLIGNSSDDNFGLGHSIEIAAVNVAPFSTPSIPFAAPPPLGPAPICNNCNGNPGNACSATYGKCPPWQACTTGCSCYCPPIADSDSADSADTADSDTSGDDSSDGSDDSTGDSSGDGGPADGDADSDGADADGEGGGGGGGGEGGGGEGGGGEGGGGGGGAGA